MKIFKKMKKGFTLVELVVVIAVIAILAAVSVGAYFGVTESANRSKLEQEGKQVHTAIQTISLAGNEHSSLTSNGLVLTNPGEFRLALEESLGKEVALTDVQNTKDETKPTIYFTDVAIQSELGDKTYKTFEYHLPEISGKAAHVDVVTGEVKVVETNATGEDIPDVLPTVKTIAEALTAEVGTPALLTGTVSGLYSGYENSFYIEDENENQILVFKGDKAAVIGDIVTVSGEIGEFGNNKQIKEGSTITIIGHDESYDEIEAITSIEDALNANDGAAVELTGEVTLINDKYTDETVTSAYIKDENGKSIYVFKMAAVVDLHDVITVTGIMGTYNGERQVTGATVTKNSVANHTYSEPTCEAPAQCIVCGFVDGEALGHNDSDGDGICNVCSKPASTEKQTIVIKDYASSNSWANGTRYTTINGEAFTITTTSTRDSGKFYSDGNEWRIYQAETPTITVAANAGYEIVKVSISYNIKNTGILLLNSNNIESGTEIDVNDDSIEFNVGNTGTATNGQVKITSISVWFAENEITEEPGTGTPSEPEVEEHKHDWSNKDGICASCSNPCEETHEEDVECLVCGFTKNEESNQPQKDPVTVKVNIGTYASANGWTNESKYTSLPLDAVITAKASGSDNNTGKYYTSGNEWRLYQTGSAKLTIEAIPGYTIQSIIVKYNSKNSGIFKEVKSGTELSVNKSSIVLNVGNSGSATNGQAKVTEITVTYIEA